MDALLIGLLPGCPSGMPGVEVADERAAGAAGCALLLGPVDGKLSLRVPDSKQAPVAVEFSAGPQGYRLAADRVRHERLIKALGGMPEKKRCVVDATGGLGRDALVMAQAGFEVTILERSEIIHALLADALQRLQHADPELAARLTLHHAEATDWLTPARGSFFAVYLDPMFPQRQKSAAIKKELLMLQQLENAPTPAEESLLLAVACTTAERRVVVKRPLKAPSLAGRKPAHHLPGRAVRFDVYLTGSDRSSEALV